MPASTCVSDPLIVGLKTPVGRVPFGLFHHEFSRNLNGRFDPDDPALASSGGASGRRPATKPLGSAVRQPYGERESSRHLSFGRLFTWPADQPRHATRHLSNPVDPGSPPNSQRASSACVEDSMNYRSYDDQVKSARGFSHDRVTRGPCRAWRPASSGRRAYRTFCGHGRRRFPPWPCHP